MDIRDISDMITKIESEKGIFAKKAYLDQLLSCKNSWKKQVGL